MRIVILLLIISSVLQVSCSSKPYRPKVYPRSVLGVITSMNNPVPDANVIFSDTTRNISVTAKTDSQGRFSVPPENIPAGRYVVYIGTDRPNIPKQYQSPLESPFVVNIEAEANDFVFELK